jgi:nicotinamide-nucleotide amidase
VFTEVIIIGDEILEGLKADANAAFLSASIAASGLRLNRITFVGDRPASIREAVLSALNRSEIVITTGGLGPTVDDRTREIVAKALGMKLIVDRDILENIRQRFSLRGIEMPASNVNQAMVPEGAKIIENRIGTAPGLLIEPENRMLFLLPGVPDEIRQMWEDYVWPALAQVSTQGECAMRTLRTTGLAESQVSDKIGSVTRRYPSVDIGFLPGDAGVDIKFIVRETDSKRAQKTLRAVEQELTDILSDNVYGSETDTLEQVVGYLLLLRRKTLAVAESMTAGLIGEMITDVPGSSTYFQGGVIAYADEVKSELLDVPAQLIRRHGAVSAEVALKMAEGVARRAMADVGVSVTGIAGPEGGSKQKPVGTVFMGLCFEKERIYEKKFFTGNRGLIRRRTAQSCLDMLRRFLLQRL